VTRRRGRARPRGTKRTVALFVGGALLLVVAATLATSFTAGNTVPPSRAGVSVQPLEPGEFPPTSVLTFPATGASYRSTTWTAGCGSAICGTAHDSAGGSNVSAVNVSILGPGGRYWNGSDFNTATTQQKFIAVGTTSWSLAFPVANFATAGGGDGTYVVKSFATDSSGNIQEPATTSTFLLDNTAPSNLLTLTAKSPAGSSVMSGNTVYYRGTAGGSFKLVDAVADSGSGPASSTVAALGGTTTGWTGTPGTVSTPAGGPYDSNTFTWAAGTSSQPTETLTGTDAAGNTSTAATLTFTNDSTPPTGGALTVNGQSAGGAGTTSFASNAAFTIGTRTDYTDAASGLASSVLTVQSFALSSSNGIAAGTCGAPSTPVSSPTVVTGTTQPGGIVTGRCYTYVLTGTDNVGNTATISTTVMLDTSAPSAPAPILSAATGNTYVSGTTVYTNPQAGKSGGFTVTATSTDNDSGITEVNFPTLTGFASGGGNDTSSPYATTYGWTGAAATSTGVQTLTATNNANLTATGTITITPDTSPPVNGALTVDGLAASAAGTTSTDFSTTIAIGTRTDYSDSGSGLLSSTLTVESETLSGSTCGAAGSGGSYLTPTTIVGTTSPTVTAGFCYVFTLTGIDRVGNTAAITTTAIDAPSLGLSGVTTGQGCPSGGCGWAVGNGGTILYTANGTSFEGEASGTSANLNDVTSPVDNTHVWAVGNGGTILECTTDCQTPGSAVWVTQASNTTANLYAVAAASNTEIWAVGAGGVIDFWNGTTWTVQQSGKAYDLLDINGTVTGTGWAVGTNGTILATTNGTNWTAQSAPPIAGSTTYTLEAVNATTASAAWAVGVGGAIIYTTNTGATWTKATSPTSNTLYDVDASGSNVSASTPVYAVGASGVILDSTNGTTFIAQTSPTGSNLLGVASQSGSTLLAVGANETILHTTTSGATWSAVTAPLIGLSPATGTSGTTVTVTGSGLAANSALTAKFNGTTVTLGGATTTSSGGAVTGATFTVPGSLTANATYGVLLTDASGNTAATTFTAG
jgi:Photosynthesis system II assembly factor YCF48